MHWWHKMLRGFLFMQVGIFTSPMVMDYSTIPEPWHTIILYGSSVVFGIGFLTFLYYLFGGK